MHRVAADAPAFCAVAWHLRYYLHVHVHQLQRPDELCLAAEGATRRNAEPGSKQFMTVAQPLDEATQADHEVPQYGRKSRQGTWAAVMPEDSRLPAPDTSLASQVVGPTPGSSCSCRRCGSAPAGGGGASVASARACATACRPPAMVSAWLLPQPPGCQKVRPASATVCSARPATFSPHTSTSTGWRPWLHSDAARPSAAPTAPVAAVSHITRVGLKRQHHRTTTWNLMSSLSM